jgi:hypothetical protein
MHANLLFLVCTVIALGGCSVIPDSSSKDDKTYGLLIDGNKPKVGEYSILPGGKNSNDKRENATLEILNCPTTVSYIALPALPVDTYNSIMLDPVTKAYVSKTQEWPKDPIEVNRLLTNISTNTNIGNSVGEAGVAGIFSAKHSRKQYVIDFMKWRGELLTTTSGAEVGWVRLGAGLRLNIDIATNDASAAGSLMALAVSAKAGKTTGSISAEIIGMDSQEVTQVTPFSVDLSEGNIIKIIETMATVKAKLYDAKIKLKPNLIARMVCAPISVAM